MRLRVSSTDRETASPRTPPGDRPPMESTASDHLRMASKAVRWARTMVMMSSRLTRHESVNSLTARARVASPTAFAVSSVRRGISDRAASIRSSELTAVLNSPSLILISSPISTPHWIGRPGPSRPPAAGGARIRPQRFICWPSWRSVSSSVEAIFSRFLEIASSESMVRVAEVVNSW